MEEKKVPTEVDQKIDGEKGQSEEKQKREEKKVELAIYFPGIGLLYAILSAAFFSAGALLVAKVPNIHAMEVTFSRMTVQLLFTVPLVLYSKEKYFGASEDRLLLWTRGMLGTWSNCLMYYAIHHMPLGDASVLKFSSPVFVGILAFFILKETCGIFETFTTVTTITGIILIARPPFMFGDTGETTKTDEPKTTYLRTIGPICALLASLCSAGVHITVRSLKHVHYSTIIFVYSLCGTVQCALLCFIVNIWTLPSGGKEWGCLLGVGLFGVAAQICFTLALKIENAGAVSVLRSTEIVFAFIWQIALVKEYPHVYTIIGAVLVMLCAVAYGVRKWHKIRTENQKKVSEETQLIDKSTLPQKDLISPS